MKVVIHADAGVKTGFGIVTHNIGDRLITQHGMEVHAIAVNWKGDPDIETPMKLWMPNRFHGDDVYGMRRIPELLSRIRPDVFFVYNDLPVALPIIDLAQRHFPDLPIALYYPIDCEPLPVAWSSPIRRSSWHATFTPWAADVVQRHFPDLPRSEVIPHGVDTSVFHPITPETPGRMLLADYRSDAVVYTREEARALLGLSDRFVILWADRNSNRKNPADFFKAAAAFIKDHPDTTLWVHCKQQDEGGDIGLWVERYGLSRHMRMTPNLDTFTGVPEWHLNALYNAADVRVSTALGEGFGLHGVEAAATGLAQIAPAVTCFPDVLGPGALYVSPETPYTTPRGVDLFLPKVGEIVDHLTFLYNNPSTRRRMGKAGRAHVTANYQWDAIAARFADGLRSAVERGTPRVLAAG